MTTAQLAAALRPMLPALIATVGNNASLRFLEFFTVNIRNTNTPAAYGRATGAFLPWSRTSSRCMLLPMSSNWTREMSPPSDKQYLASIRVLFDSLVKGQVMPTKPAHSARRPRHFMSKGSTLVLSSDETTMPAGQHG